MEHLQQREDHLTALLHHVQLLNNQFAILCSNIKQQYQIEPSTDVLVLQHQLSNLRDFFNVLKVLSIYR